MGKQLEEMAFYLLGTAFPSTDELHLLEGS